MIRRVCCVRAGLAREKIEEALGRPLAAAEQGGPLHAPGQLESHYAPHAKMRLNARDWQAGEARLGFGTSGCAAQPVA